MAEIVLGRMLGPSGFQRAVVIKRILPHLARDPQFVGMFLDEARIVAGIRHPNVVQVQELGHEGGHLFLVMEYLEGESVSGLTRRLLLRRERLSYDLAAHVVAEACGGLHAAHELTDPNGQPQNVVHRDVSPQNVFVGYNGAVKILDFGIAVAADRTTRTETGMFKGKFEYSSPEQCQTRALDRRSDVFALGILLYEVSTGLRLFKRLGQLETLRAICEQPIVPPTAIVDGYPETLSEVVMRALERKPENRFQTARDMRQALLVASRGLSDEVAPGEKLALLMQQLFPERIRDKAEMLRRVQIDDARDLVIDIPSVDTDASVEIPVAFGWGSNPPPPARTDIATADVSLVTPAQRVSSSPISYRSLPSGAPDSSPLSSPELYTPGPIAPPTAQQQRIPFGLIALILVLLALLGVGVAGMIAWRRATTESATAAAAATLPPSANASADPLTTSASAVAVATATATASASAPAPHDRSSEIVVHVETTPARAHVLLGGKEKGLSPIDLKLPRGSQALDLEIRHDGYKPLHERVVPDTDQKLKLTLVGGPPPSTGRDTRPAATPTASGVPYHRFD